MTCNQFLIISPVRYNKLVDGQQAAGNQAANHIHTHTHAQTHMHLPARIGDYTDFYSSRSDTYTHTHTHTHTHSIVRASEQHQSVATEVDQRAF